MRVLNANYLINYLNGGPDAEAYYESNGGDKELWVMPAPAYAETLVGVGNHPTGDADRAIEALSWGEVYDIDKDLSVEAARIADEIGLQGRISTVSTRSLPQSGENLTHRWFRRTATSPTKRRRRLSRSTNTDVQ